MAAEVDVLPEQLHRRGARQGHLGGRRGPAQAQNGRDSRGVPVIRRQDDLARVVLLGKPRGHAALDVHGFRLVGLNGGGAGGPRRYGLRRRHATPRSLPGAWRTRFVRKGVREHALPRSRTRETRDVHARSRSQGPLEVVLYSSAPRAGSRAWVKCETPREKAAKTQSLIFRRKRTASSQWQIGIRLIFLEFEDFFVKPPRFANRALIADGHGIVLNIFVRIPMTRSLRSNP